MTATASAMGTMIAATGAAARLAQIALSQTLQDRTDALTPSPIGGFIARMSF